MVPAAPDRTAPSLPDGVVPGALGAESDPGAPAAKRRGPGRDLRAAIPVGIGLVGVLLVCLFVVPVVFPAFIALALVLAVLELTRALSAGGMRVPVMPVLVGVIGMVVTTEVFRLDGLVVATALAVCVLILWRVTESMGTVALRDVAAGVFTIAWVPFLGCFSLLLFDRPDGALLVLLAFLVPVANDTGGFIAGVLMGRHPMAPSISPKKSWEGFFGSLVLGTAAAVVFLLLADTAPWWTGLVIGPVLVIISTCGDLAESLLKRDLGIKDMGHMLPGHGGVLDRIDSILLAAPATFILLEVLV
ncbi:phosphatidate cytidylyltransferase [Brachybacterium subflavum]|uniref:phosphatidate cytidylyltransferase n=1 Tax=Brachybacterium subflavum TaxID=2585206 RepID=UPI001D0D023E|nr:phosphatidate cytidylyltransferase [Brachybacterium subflavum]